MLVQLLAACAPALHAPALRAPRGAARVRLSMTATATAYDTEAFNSVVQTTYGRFQLAVERGDGCTLIDTDGKSYLDFAAGIAACTLGHANPRLADAVAAQMRRVNHVSNLYYIPEQGKLASRLVASSCLDRAFFCNSGAEANEAAIKLARRHAVTTRGIDRPVIVTAMSSFHGRTLGALAATGQTKYQDGFGPMLEGFEHVEYNDVDALRRVCAGLDGRLAAILLEPLQGEGGIRPGTKEYFAAARQICDETGALLMVDEVQTGIGRTGTFWGHQQLDVEPDVLTSAKALGGGVPIGAMLTKSSCDVLTPGTHASTYGGNPLACAAANAVLDAIEDERLLDNVAARSAQLVDGIGAMRGRLPDGAITEVRGKGLILGIELGDGVTAAQLCAETMRLGLLTVPAGLQVRRARQPAAEPHTAPR